MNEAASLRGKGAGMRVSQVSCRGRWRWWQRSKCDRLLIGCGIARVSCFLVSETCIKTCTNHKAKVFCWNGWDVSGIKQAWFAVDPVCFSWFAPRLGSLLQLDPKGTRNTQYKKAMTYFHCKTNKNEKNTKQWEAKQQQRHNFSKPSTCVL